MVNDPASKKNFRGEITGKIGDFAQLLRGEFTKKQIDVKHLEGGKEPSQLFWNTVCDPFCVNEEVLRILKENELTGWKAIPATVTDKNKKKWKNYFAITVTGRTNHIDYMDSVIVFNKMPGGLFPSFKGLYFTPDTWDGSDIFMERADNNGKATAFVYVTKRLVDIFKKHKITNVDFLNFNEFEMDCSSVIIGADDEKYVAMLEKKIAKASA